METHCLLLPTQLHPEQLDLWEQCGAPYISLIIYTDTDLNKNANYIQAFLSSKQAVGLHQISVICQ